MVAAGGLRTAERVSSLRPLSARHSAACAQPQPPQPFNGSAVPTLPTPTAFTRHVEITGAATGQAVAASIFLDDQLRAEGTSVADIPIPVGGQGHRLSGTAAESVRRDRQGK